MPLTLVRLSSFFLSSPSLFQLPDITLWLFCIFFPLVMDMRSLRLQQALRCLQPPLLLPLQLLLLRVLVPFLSPKSSLIFVMNSFPHFVHPLRHISCFSLGPILVEVAPPSRFEVCSSSATVPNPMSDAVAFFIRFNQPEVNDHDPTNF